MSKQDWKKLFKEKSHEEQVKIAKAAKAKAVSITGSPPSGYTSAKESTSEPPPTPDWKYWELMEDVELWQAVFLSCNIDPRSQNYRDIDHFGWDNVDANNRIQILKKHHTKEKYFSSGIINLSNPEKNGINLSEFAAWCLLHKEVFDIPEELVALAKKPDTAIVEEPAKEENKQTPPVLIKRIEGEGNNGVEKKEIINAFRGIHYLTDKHWSKALAAPPNWLKSCRVEIGRKGSKTKSALWNPVCIALGLYEKPSSVKKLDQIYDRTIRIKDLNDVFKEWEEWKDEWDERSFHLQPQNT